VGCDFFGSCCAGRDGVYFAASDGIYVTAGGTPRKLSRALNPYFGVGVLSPLFTAGSGFTGDTVPPRLAFVQDRLHVAVTEVGASREPKMLVYDPATDDWMFWETSAGESGDNSTYGLASLNDVLYVGNWNDVSGTDTANIYKLDPTVTADDSEEIPSHYQTGFSDFGHPGQVKDIDGTRLWGTGTVAVSDASDFGSLGSATNVTLGAAPAIDQALYNKQQTGEVISTRFSSVSGGAWVLHRYGQILRGVYPPDER
jgi:hypothetical protein